MNETDVDALFRLDGKVAVVTGASQKIGKAIAQLLAAAGADLVITARGAERLETVAEEIRASSGRTVLAVPSDITRPEDRTNLARMVLERFDHVDVLMNNAYAGTNPVPIAMLEQHQDRWEESIQGNLFGPYDLTKAFAPGMLAAGSGSIVNFLSTAAFNPIYGQAAYGVVKAALGEMTRYLAQELAPTIRVNALCPGTISETGEIEDERHRGLTDFTPLGRLGRAAELAPTALYLASEASCYTTGQFVFVDGGRVNVGTAGRPAPN